MHFFQILLFCIFLWLIHRNTARIADSLSDYLIKLFVNFVACIIPIGFLLSEFNLINQPFAWNFGIIIFAGIIYFLLKSFVKTSEFNLKESLQNLKNNFPKSWENLSFSSKFIFGILSITLLFTTIINIIVVFVAAPNEWDSMTGHLVKCAYYLQNGNMNRVGGTMWSVDYYPNSLPTLQIFGYHIFHSEKGFKLIHYLSYWVFALASYGTAKKISQNKTASLFVFLITALLPTALVQATTTETDIVLTAYLSCLVYFLFSYKNSPSKLNIVLIGLTTCILLGHKITFLLISPAVLLVGIYTVALSKAFLKKVPILLVTMAICFVLYVLPTGYLGNIRESGKFSISCISGPKEVMNWFRPENYTTKDLLKYGTLNVGRYASDFLNLDGIRSTEIGKKVNDAMRFFPNKVFEKLHLEQDKFWAVSPFYVKNPPIEFHQERPYWGIISFGLVLPIMLFLFFNFRKNWKDSQKRSLIVLSIAAIIHFLSLCYTAAYDPIKGRYFMNLAVWCMPLLVESRKWKMVSLKGTLITYHLSLITLIISLSAICIVFNKRIHPIFGEKNIFNMSRMEQMTLLRPDIYEAYKKYDELVPKNAIVALGTTREDFEYPLWGKNFSRKLIPIHPFGKVVKPIPKEANYLFYSEGVLPFQAGDIQLNEEDKNNDTPVKENIYYLRPLIEVSNHPNGGIKKQNEE
jgi:hypothetical protein